MLQFTTPTPTQELQHLQARIAAVTRGLQNNPGNARDYAQALEVQVMLLKEVIHRLNSPNQGVEQQRELHHYYADQESLPQKSNKEF